MRIIVDREYSQELGIEYAKPMNLYCDNKSAIEIAQNLVQHDRTKHVEIDQHFIMENFDKKIIQRIIFFTLRSHAEQFEGEKCVSMLRQRMCDLKLVSKKFEVNVMNYVPNSILTIIIKAKR